MSGRVLYEDGFVPLAMLAENVSYKKRKLKLSVSKTAFTEIDLLRISDEPRGKKFSVPQNA